MKVSSRLCSYCSTRAQIQTHETTQDRIDPAAPLASVVREERSVHPDNQYSLVEGARLLPEYGANVDAKDIGGMTPIQLALAHGVTS